MSRFPELPESLADNPEIVAEHRRMILDDIRRTIRMSEVRCLAFDEILRRIEQLWEDPQAGEIVWRVCEESLSHNQLHALAASVQQLADSVDRLPSACKASPDRAIRRILSRMPAEIAAPVAEQWLDHPRKFRREIAYRVLRDCGLTAASGKRLMEVFHRTGDQECLKLIARHPIAIGELDVPAILDAVTDEYWRTRVVQAALVSNRSTAMALADSHPREFLHSTGRLRDATLMPTLRQLFDRHSQDLSFLSLYAWALGQLEAHAELSQLKLHIDSQTNNESLS